MKVETTIKFTLNTEEKAALQKAKEILNNIMDYLYYDSKEEFNTYVDFSDIYNTVGIIETVLEGSE